MPNGCLNYCFTWNNPPVAQGGSVIQPEFLEEGMYYLVYQYEVSSSGTFHWQGYVEFKTRKTLAQAKLCLASDAIHLEKRRGTQAQAIAYCKKQESRAPGATPFEHGEPKTTNQGSRTDIVEFKDAIKNGKRKRELIEDQPMMIAKYARFYDTVRGLYPPEDKPVKVYLLIGPPGCGKTRTVFERYRGEARGELFEAPLNNGTMWWDGYDGHPSALFDDFAGAASRIGLTELLKVLDRYPVQVPVKGGFVWWSPDRIYITTNIYPREWYKWEGRAIQYQALARRFHCVFDFYEMEEGGDPPVGDNTLLPYIHAEYIEHGISLQGCSCPPRYEGKNWWVKEKPDEATEW